MFERKLAAWLSRPWYDAFIPTNEVSKWRDRWRSEAYALLGFKPDELLTKLDDQVDTDERFPKVDDFGANFSASPEFRHPLSGMEETPAKGWHGSGSPLEDLHATCISALKTVAGHLPNDHRKAFLWLWRKAPSLAKEAELGCATRLGAFWDLAPAYANFPFSTIWQRQAAVASLASAGSTPAFFSFRLGGVQEFIGKSRTTEDYWSGSYLVSFLTWQAARVIAEEIGPDAVLFPSLRGQPLVDLWLSETLGEVAVGIPSRRDLEVGNFPNGLLAIVPFKTEKEAREFAGKVVLKFEESWNTISFEVRELLASGIRETCPAWRTTPNWNEIWRRQTKPESIFEIFWTLTPRKTEESYAGWYSRASRQMESRKTLRDFRSTVESGTKCHQTGTGAALHTPDSKALDNERDFWETLSKLPKPLKFRFRKSERLSAVSIVRRLAARTETLKSLLGNRSFPSTASIAATPILKTLIEKPKPELLKAFSDSLQKLLKAFDYDNDGKIEQSPFPLIFAGATGWDYLSCVDGSWWFDESYETDALVKQHDRKKVTDAAVDIQTTRTALKALLEESPPKYYAVLAVDGDETGMWINGINLGLWSQYLRTGLNLPFATVYDKRPTSPLTHRAIMECLANLPLCVAREKIDRCFEGQLVYAGGDDMLAFVPAHNLAGGMDEYAKAFCENFLLTGDSYQLLPGAKFTASIAAMLVHYKTPMSGVVEEALTLCEETAKEGFGRDCGVISLRRQSGQETVTGAKWGNDFRPFHEAQKLTGYLRGGKLSSRFIAHVAEIRPALEDLKDPEAEVALLRRIFTHIDGPDDAIKEWLGDQAKPLLESWGPEANWVRVPKQTLSPWRELESFLLTVRFLARMTAS